MRGFKRRDVVRLHNGAILASGRVRSMGPRRIVRMSAIVGVAALAMASFASARVSSAAHDSLTAALIDSFRRPPASVVPAPVDNPITAQKVALGKALFFDPRLSGSGAIACASCHNPALGWQDGLRRGVGHNGALLPRRTPTILNVAWAEPLFWDGRADTLEEQAKGPIAAATEMNMPLDRGVAVVRGIAGYRAGFAAAFPGEPISIETIVKAIASYQRTVVSGVAPFDRWVGGDGNAIPDSAKRGFLLFNTKAGCAACHSGWRLTDDGFHDIGLPDKDEGRARIMPGVEILDHAFKTPTLRNIAERAPYMHDGSIPTLVAVIDHYDGGFVDRASLAPEVRRPKLTAPEKADLLAFMQSLSSRDMAVVLPTLPR